MSQTDQDDDYYDDDYDDSRVELPNRPTPYEVWATKNEVIEVVKAPRVMKDEEWDGTWMHACAYARAWEDWFGEGGRLLCE